MFPPLRPFVALAGLALLASGCGTVLGTAPAPTPLDFPGIAGELGQRGIVLTEIVSGDAGCDDITLGRTAIGFTAAGLDLADPVRLRVYIFADADAYARRRTDVDRCAEAWATDVATFETVDAPPFVLAGQGPWPPEFMTAVRAAIVEAAGTGG